MIVGQLKRAHILDWRQRVLATHGPGVANNALSALKTCLREGYFREELSLDPCLGVGKINVDRREIGTFTAEELRSVDFDTHVIRVEQAFKYKTGQLGKPKWDRVRVCPLPTTTAKALKTLRAESEYVLPDCYVFCHPDGARLSDQWWNDRFHLPQDSSGEGAFACLSIALQNGTSADILHSVRLVVFFRRGPFHE